MTERPGAIGVRLAGLPVTALADLRCANAAERIEQILALEEWLATEAAALSDALHDTIGTLGSPPLKPRLIGLRRAIFAGRRPPRHLFDDAVVRSLPTPLVERIRRWTQHQEDRQALREKLRAELPADVAAAARALRATLSDRTLLSGLLYSSAAAYRDARRWVDRSGRPPADRTAVRLARYVSRAAAKTSPLSQFTSVGLGSWRRGGPTLVVRDGRPTSVVELSMVTLNQVVGELARHPRTAGRLLVRVNPTVTLQDDAVHFIAPGAAGSARAVRASPAVQALLPMVPQRQPLEELERLLAAKLGDGRDTSRAADFLDRLLRMGLLELHLPIPDQALTARTLLSWLDEQAGSLVDDDDLARLHRAVRDVVDDLDGYARTASPEDRLAHRERLDTAPARLTTAGAGQPVRSAGPPTFFENAVLAGESVVADPRQWDTALDDLAAIATFGELFDPGLSARLLLATFVAERYGVGARVPFVPFYAAYEAELRGEPGPAAASVAAAQLDPVAPWLAVPGRTGTATPDARTGPAPALTRLARLRQQAVDLLRTPPDPATGVLTLTPRQLRQAAAGLHTGRPPYQTSVACYVQPMLGTDQPHLVLNTIRIGMGAGRTRIRRLFRNAFPDATDATDAGAAPVPPRRPGEPLYVEVESVFGSTLNQHDRSFDHVLSYPGTVSERPAAHQVRLADLYVVHDPAADRARLAWSPTGTEVVPVHLGLLATPMLPPAVAFLVALFGPGSYMFNQALLTGSRSADRADGRAEPAAAVRSWPRLTVGAVTLRRAGWWVPDEQLRRRAPGETDDVYLLELARWRRRHAIPDRCFVRMTRSEPASGAAGSTPRFWLDKDRKPMYIDFASWHLVRHFERMTGDPGVDLTITEALPDPADAPRTASGQRRAVELIVELPLAPMTVGG